MSGFAETTARHFVNNTTGILHNLNENHVQPIANYIAPHTTKLVNHLKSKIAGGSYGSPGAGFTSGGSMPIGGHIADDLDVGGAIASGGYLPEPRSPKEMYHYMLNLTPQQFEAHREVAAQMLGGVPSPMWDHIVDGKEPLQTDANEYENIMRMPNQHAAARLIEADQGGGFYKALKHVGKKVTALYKVGRAGLKFVNRNKDLLLDLPGVRDYKEGISGFLDTANAIDEAVNPLVDAAIDASRENATQEQRDRLKSMATKSIDTAIQTHLPQASKYVDAAKDAYNTVQQIKQRQSHNINQ